LPRRAAAPSDAGAPISGCVISSGAIGIATAGGLNYY